MNQLVELLFQRVQHHRTNELVHYLLADEQARLVEASEINENEWSEVILDPLKAAMRGGSAAAISIRADSVRIGSLAIQQPLIQIVRVKDELDVGVSFDLLSQLHTSLFPTMLYEEVQKAAALFCVSEFACGYDSADDVETRFFSSRGLGPLLLKSPTKDP